MNQQTLDPTGASRRVPDQQPIDEWASLQHGNRVEVWSADSLPYAAYVDESADNGQLIWLIENGTGSRRLFVRDDSVALYLT